MPLKKIVKREAEEDLLQAPFALERNPREQLALSYPTGGNRVGKMQHEFQGDDLLAKYGMKTLLSFSNLR